MTRGVAWSYDAFIEHVLDLRLHYFPQGVRSFVLGTPNGSRVAYRYLMLNDVSMTYALVLRDLTAFWSARDVMSDVLLGLYSTRVSARAGKTPSMGIVRAQCTQGVVVPAPARVLIYLSPLVGS